MTRYKFMRRQFLPISKYRAWDFFSSPRNLPLITPRKIGVEITGISGGERIYEGQVVSYRFLALPLIRIGWETVITDVRYCECFTHRQRKGPYASWAHRHSFTSVPGGVEIEDNVEYALPFGWFGRLANAMLVRRELEEVFDYRSVVLREYFTHPQVDSNDAPDGKAVASLPDNFFDRTDTDALR
jgi:ligand-binding SRPBCC domain-containing protein